MSILSSATGALRKFGSLFKNRAVPGPAPAGQAGNAPAIAPVENLSRRDRMEKTIAEFDEDAEAPVIKIVVTFFLFLFSVGTIFLAVLVGLSFGEAFAGPFRLDAEVTGIYTASVFIELSFAGLAIAISRAIGRSGRERLMLTLFVLALALFLIIGAGSAFAQYVLLSSIVHKGSAWQTAIIFRSIVPSLFDVAASVFISIYSRKNLAKFLKEQEQRETAIEAMSKMDIRITEAYEESDLRRQQKEEELAARRRREAVLNAIETKLSDAAVSAVEGSIERMQLPAAQSQGGSNMRRIS